MENIIHNELIKNSAALLKKPLGFSPSYQQAMLKAHEIFKNLGIPSRKNEDWKYTSIEKNLSIRFFEDNVSIVSDVPKSVIDQRGMIIFNNGVFNKFLSVLPEGLELTALINEDIFLDSFDALNFSTAISPLSLKIKKNTVIDFPITIIHLVDDVAVNKIICPRIMILAEENSKLSIMEIFECNKPELLQYTTNAVTQFSLKANAHIEHVKIQNEARSATHIGLTNANVCAGAKFKSLTLDLGLKMARNNINVSLNEPNAQTSVHGLFALKNTEHTDVFSVIKHFAGHTFSDQLFKGILAGESHGIFTGKIIIVKDAQLCTSSQLNKNLLLSKKAHIDTRPQLLVHADDVKCSHGATIGQLSDEEAFYLESRGLPKEKAKQMLCHGFATDALDKIENDKIRQFCEKIFVTHFKVTALDQQDL